MLLRQRAAPLRVQVDCADVWRPSVTAALSAAGVVADPEASVGLAVTPGRLVSRTVDDWTVSSLPHLLLSVRPHAVEVGPWAAPGIGPCARCVAAAVLDEGRPARPDDVRLPLLALAAGSAARDLGRWAGNETPHTWLTSWVLDDEPLPRSRRWARHPYCGCGWFDTA